MSPAHAMSRFDLYGEQAGKIAPEFLHIEPISTRSRLHDWTISPHSHPGIHQVLLLESGSGELQADGQATVLAAPALVTIPSHCVHAFRFDPGSEGWVCSFAVELLHDPRLAVAHRQLTFVGTGTRVDRPDPGSRPYARLQWLLDDLNAELGKGTPLHLSDCLAAQVELLLATVEELLHERSDAAAPDRQRDLALAFRQMVDAHFRDWSDVPAYARALGSTVPTLTRACRAVLGKPPGEVLRDRLLLEAMRHLTFTSASISSIAGELGFSDPAYFARFFKQRAGVCATTFRRQRAWFAQ